MQGNEDHIIGYRVVKYNIKKTNIQKSCTITLNFLKKVQSLLESLSHNNIAVVKTE